MTSKDAKVDSKEGVLHVINDQSRTRHGVVVPQGFHPQHELDYYLLFGPDRNEFRAAPEGILVEEFIRDHEFVTVGLHAAAWRAEDARWLSCASFSRFTRTDPVSLSRVVPSDRSGAEIAYQQLGGGQLPDEVELRSSFLDYEAFPIAPLLRLGPVGAPAGFREKRIYRVLFAKDLQAEQLRALRDRWNPQPSDRDVGAPRLEMPAGTRRAGNDLFTWSLRHIGGGIAWGLDVTALLASDLDNTVGPVLHDLTEAVRWHGLIPVITERLG